MHCTQCESELDDAFRYCPWCAAPQRTKIVEHFRAHPLLETGPVGLRVSRYLRDTRHVRLSIWKGEKAVAAIALEEREARRLGIFLAESAPAEPMLSRLARTRSRLEALAGRTR
jgi:hypothetical protein